MSTTLTVTRRRERETKKSVGAWNREDDFARALIDLIKALERMLDDGDHGDCFHPDVQDAYLAARECLTGEPVAWHGKEEGTHFHFIGWKPGDHCQLCFEESLEMPLTEREQLAFPT